MLRAAIDRIVEFGPSSVALVLAHVGALIWALLPRGSIRPVLVLNLVLATGILAYNIPHAALLFANADTMPLALVAFALINFLASAAALLRLRVPVAIIWILFGVDFALCVLLMVFLLTFKITRLI